MTLSLWLFLLSTCWLAEAKPSDRIPQLPWNVDNVPVQFTYDGEKWSRDKLAWRDESHRQESRYSFDHAATGLRVEVTGHRLQGFDASEWVVRFTNNGTNDTPILEDVFSGSFRLSPSANPYELHYAEGSSEKETDFQPLEKPLKPGTSLSLAPNGGRSSDGFLPYFHLLDPKGGGWFLAIGWTGQWKATFECGGDGSVTIQLGMERTHLKLHPKESIRTPSILTMRHKGDLEEGHNHFRRLMLTHYTPQFGGKPFRTFLAASAGTVGFNNVSESNQTESIERVAQHTLPVDAWWIDAGWEVGGFPQGQGNAAIDSNRFPRGLGPVGLTAHSKGLNFLLWFEPERVMRQTTLYREHRDWLLSPADLPPQLAYQRNDGFHLLDLGNPKALTWAKEHYSKYLTDFHVDVYRQDCNLHPLYYWRNDEPPDRQGIREIRYIEGLYDFLDTLLRDHPGLLIDNCASGGRRLDFEMMRRSVPLWRSDLCWKPVPTQSMTYGLARWLPLTGVGAVSTEAYDFRSGMGAHMSLAFDYHKEGATFWEPLAKRIEEFRAVETYFAGDFHPLTPYSINEDAWIAWQFHQSTSGEGVIQAFRRSNASETFVVLKLKNLNSQGKYEVRDFDGTTKIYSGEELTKGFQIEAVSKPWACLFSYRPVKN